ncbi:MAG: hypothetical protein J3R72DRAFT_491799 [Linnemannia gamsii]|nr:MAG: hypothetical protein J3R72DRAFT_491799 [Linnemannia gamsii]
MPARNMSPRSLKLMGLFIVELVVDARDAGADAGVTERGPHAGHNFNEEQGDFCAEDGHLPPPLAPLDQIH